MERVRAYTVRHSGSGEMLGGLIEDYRSLLQEAVDKVWSHITWREKPNTGPWKGIGARRGARGGYPSCRVKAASNTTNYGTHS